MSWRVTRKEYSGKKGVRKQTNKTETQKTTKQNKIKSILGRQGCVLKVKTRNNVTNSGLCKDPKVNEGLFDYSVREYPGG